ncbi:MAG: DUF456 family protein [Bacteroidales bacterium]|nr:DUF456 family protein [Bacteroidales bacterium]
MFDSSKIYIIFVVVILSMETLFLIIGILLMIGCVFVSFYPIAPAALLSYVAMWILDANNIIFISKNTLLFWAIATLIVLLNFYMTNVVQNQPHKATKGLSYIIIGALAGCFTGMTISASGITIGTSIGAIMGSVIYCRTPQGKATKLMSFNHIMYLADKGLPTIVAISILGIIINNLLLLSTL